MTRVLLAEDDEANRLMLTRVLEKHGYAVVGVANGLEVLNALDDARVSGERYSALLLDWMMPGLSGIAALPDVRKREPDLPIIMLTARSGRDDVLGAFQLGADDYVTKPFDFDVLLARIEARVRSLVRRETEPSTKDPEIGFVVDGRYMLTEQIGSGAFGIVYRAHHLALETDVAVKMLKASASSGPPPIGPVDSLGQRLPNRARSNDASEEFRREGVRACRVQHANAVKIFDYGVLASGKAYLVMELLRGRTLDDELRALGRLPLRRAVEVMRPVLECLAAAHAKSVVHRDIKPANIFLHQPAGDGEVVKVLDFGVAKLLDGDAAITRETVPGSPSYMAPERLRGAKYDGRSDVYAVGVTFYELLTGHVPFRSPTGDIYDVVLKHLREDATPPSALVPTLPPAVDAVVMALLSKDPLRRPSALEAASRLVGLLDEQVTVAVDLDDVDLTSTPIAIAQHNDNVSAVGVVGAVSAVGRVVSRPVALVVDDDPATQRLIALALRELGTDVALFADAESALANLKLVKPAFALIDVTLPGMSGLELARLIGNNDETRATPILVMSAAGGADAASHEQAAMQLGAFFLTKPFRLAVFNEAMRELHAERTRRKSERKKPRILIVDDDDGIRDALRNIVGEEGYEAVCAADAFEALSLCGAAAPPIDVAVIDVMLPGLDGPGLAARFKATKHLGSVPIVMISAFDSLQTHAARVGASAALKKPFDLGHFIALLRKTVGESVCATG